MKLESLKAVLIKKADGNNNLSSMILSMGEDTFAEAVVEALEKMAKPTHLTGTNANGPVTSFGANLDKTDMMQLRDALSHHLSHYKAALKQHHEAPEGSPEKAHFRQVADKHLEHVLPLMHLAARASAHSKGKMAIDYPPLAPWETNYTTLDRNPNGRFVRDAKLLRARPSPGAREGGRGIKDYRYFEMPPHPGHDEVSKMPHQGGYPWEEIQLGDPKDIDAKKAYLHIEDVPDKKDYSPHPFDQHPIRGVQDIQADHLTPESLQTFAGGMQNWRGGEHHKKWMEDQKAKFAADKEGFMKRGQAKSKPLYEGMPLLEQPAHVHTVTKKTPFSEKQAEQSKAVAPAVRKPEPAAAAPAQAASAPHPLEETYQIWKGLPKQHKDKLHDSIPGLAEYVKSKGGK